MACKELLALLVQMLSVAVPRKWTLSTCGSCLSVILLSLICNRGMFLNPILEGLFTVRIKIQQNLLINVARCIPDNLPFPSWKHSELYVLLKGKSQFKIICENLTYISWGSIPVKSMKDLIYSLYTKIKYWREITHKSLS